MKAKDLCSLENEIAICDRNQAKGNRKQQLGNENGNGKPKKERMSYTKVYGTPLLFTGKQAVGKQRKQIRGKRETKRNKEKQAGKQRKQRKTEGNKGKQRKQIRTFCGKQGETRETNEGKRKTALRRKTTAGNSYENSATVVRETRKRIGNLIFHWPLTAIT